MPSSITVGRLRHDALQLATIALGWAVVVLLSEFGIRNIGYGRPESLLWMLATVVSVGATVVALALVVIYVVARCLELARKPTA